VLVVMDRPAVLIRSLTHSIQSKPGAYYIEASAPQNKAGGGLLSAALPDDSRFAFTQAFSVLGAFTG